MEEYIGNEFLREDQNVSKPDFRSMKFWGMYFSASWCPPCKYFTPKLIDFYKAMKEKKFEVLLVSHDYTEKEYSEYQQTMPWTAIPFKNQEKILELTGIIRPMSIPYLCIFDGESGRKITCQGQSHILQYGEGAWQLWENLAQELLSKQQKKN